MGGQCVYPTRETVDRLRAEYPPGTRIELVSTADPLTDLKPGDRGTVKFVADTGSVFVSLNNNALREILYGIDEIRKI